MKIHRVAPGMVVLVMLFALTVGGITATLLETQGIVVKVRGNVVFLEGSTQPAYHVAEGSQVGGAASLSDLVGKSVSIVYYPDGNRNMIQTLQVAE